MTKPTLLMTGGGGFIGRPLAAALEDDYEVHVFDRPKDVRRVQHVFGAFRDVRPAVCIHLAGLLGTHELFDNIDDAIDVNIKGTSNVLKCCNRFGARYVGITMPPVFPSIYTATKVCATLLATAFHHTYGLPVSHVQAFNAFGPGQAYGEGHPQKFLPTFAIKAWRGEPLPIWGNGSQTIDAIHTDELAQVFRCAIQHGDDFRIDGGTGIPISVNEMADFVLKHTGSKGGIEYLPMRRGEIPTKIVAEGEGWHRCDRKPEFNWEQVRDTIDWYADHPAVAA